MRLPRPLSHFLIAVVSVCAAPSAALAADGAAGFGLDEFFARDPDLYRVLVTERAASDFTRRHARASRKIRLARYGRFYFVTDASGRDTGYVLHPSPRFDADGADFLNCKYVVVSGRSPLEGNPSYRKVAEGKKYRVYLNETVLPRIFIAHESRVAAAEETAGAYRADALKRAVYLDADSGEKPMVSVRRSGRPDRVRVIRYDPDRIEAEITAASDGYVVFTEPYEAGWSARVDGRPARVLRNGGRFCAVGVTAGSRRVRFDRSRRSWFPWAASGAVAVLFVVLRRARVINFSRHD